MFKHCTSKKSNRAYLVKMKQKLIEAAAEADDQDKKIITINKVKKINKVKRK